MFLRVNNSCNIKFAIKNVGKYIVHIKSYMYTEIIIIYICDEPVIHFTEKVEIWMSRSFIRLEYRTDVTVSPIFKNCCWILYIVTVVNFFLMNTVPNTIAFR